MTSLLQHCPGSACVGRRRFVRREPLVETLFRWTRSCPRTGGALYAQPKVTARRASRNTILDSRKFGSSFLNFAEVGPLDVPRLRECQRHLARLRAQFHSIYGRRVVRNALELVVGQPMTPITSVVARRRAGVRLVDDQLGREDYFSRTITNEPGRAAGRTTHPEFRVALQPPPCRVVPSSGPLTGTDNVEPSAARKTPPLALRRPH